MVKNKINIEVAYATPLQQKIISVLVDENCSLKQAILLSGILEIFPEIDLENQKVGIFSKIKDLDDLIQGGDRIEIYRPLALDPKEARRRRSIKKI